MRLRVAEIAERLLVRFGEIGALLEGTSDVVVTLFLERFVLRK